MTLLDDMRRELSERYERLKRGRGRTGNYDYPTTVNTFIYPRRLNRTYLLLNEFRSFPVAVSQR